MVAPAIITAGFQSSLNPSTRGQISPPYFAPAQESAVSRILDFRQLVFDATAHPVIEDIWSNTEEEEKEEESVASKSGVATLRTGRSGTGPPPFQFEFTDSRQPQDPLICLETEIPGSPGSHMIGIEAEVPRSPGSHMIGLDMKGKHQSLFTPLVARPLPSHNLSLEFSLPVQTVHPAVGSTVYGELGRTPAPSPPFQPIPAPPLPYLSMMHVPSPYVSSLLKPSLALGVQLQEPGWSLQVAPEGRSHNNDVPVHTTAAANDSESSQGDVYPIRHRNSIT
jgi:hypothetical protein